MLKQVLYRDIFILPIVNAVLVQMIKVVVYSAVNRRFEFTRFVQADGMPNLHAAVFGSISSLVGIKYGYSSILFSITTTFSVIIMHDTMRVKREKEKQTGVLRTIISSVKEYEDLRSVKISRVLQFRPLDVITGCALGVILTYILL